jgi:NAD(P)H-dependent FMN reductase
MKLNVIVCSTRPGRVGLSVARWAHEAAVRHAGFEAELVDLADFNLPVYDEPKHPRLRDYQHEHTRRWAASVESADAYVFVTPEYNYFPPPSLVNAVNYVFHEWCYKPAGLVSYGGISGGLRAAQAAKTLLSTVKLVPLTEGVPVPQVGEHIKDGVFQATDHHEGGMATMLNEMVRWATALKTMRN